MFWVAVIVAILVGYKMWRPRMTRGMHAGRDRADDQLLASMQLEINRLAERVQVLERLATDDDRNLSREIDNLRDHTGARP